jgi:hypothetical protein
MRVNPGFVSLLLVYWYCCWKRQSCNTASSHPCQSNSNRNTNAYSNTGTAAHADAEINPTGQGYTLTDLGSTNGTFVNGLRLAPYVPYVLKLQDSIQIGQNPFTFEMTHTPEIAPAKQPGYLPLPPSQPPRQPINQPPWTKYPQQNRSPQYVSAPPPAQCLPYYVQATTNAPDGVSSLLISNGACQCETPTIWLSG